MYKTKDNIRIKDHDHFLSLIFKFDKNNRTRTRFGKTSICDLFDNVLQIDEKTYVTRRVGGCIKNSFTYYDDIVFDSKFKNFGLHQKKAFILFQTIYRLKNDLLEGKKIEDPICITGYDNLVYKVHPGSKRILLGSIYKEPVNFILSEYCEPRKLLLTTTDFDVDWPAKDYYFRIGDYDEGFHPEGHQRKNCEFKDIIHHASSTEYDKIDENIIFYLKNNHEIYANDLPILRKENDHWKVI